MHHPYVTIHVNFGGQLCLFAMPTRERIRRLTPLFKVGDKVLAKAFTDCCGKHHPQSEPLTVESVTFVENEHAPHVRLRARHPDGWGYHEAAQRFFAPVRRKTTSQEPNL